MQKLALGEPGAKADAIVEKMMHVVVIESMLSIQYHIKSSCAAVRMSVAVGLATARDVSIVRSAAAVIFLDVSIVMLTSSVGEISNE